MVKIENVDAELRLCTGNHSTESASSEAGNRQQIAIFYDGQIRTCDVTEIQARAIISFAKKEMEQQYDGKPLTQSAVAVEPQLLNPRLAMRHSLQRFLQKRKARLSASTPYNRFSQP